MKQKIRVHESDLSFSNNVNLREGYDGSLCKYQVSLEVIEALRQGNHEAYAEILSHYRTPVRDFVCTLIRSHEVAEDITHDVFIGLWENRKKLEPAKGIRHYLYTGAKRMAMHYFRQKTEGDVKIRYGNL